MERKEKFTNLLKKCMDMENLQVCYDGLTDEKAKDDKELIALLKKLSRAMSANKKMMSLALRQGQLLREAKKIKQGSVQASPQKVSIYYSICQFPFYELLSVSP